MTAAGARGATERQMVTALHLELPRDRRDAAFDAIARTITAPTDPGRGAIKLTVASSIWTQQGYPLTLSFLDTLTRSVPTCSSSATA